MACPLKRVKNTDIAKKRMELFNPIRLVLFDAILPLNITILQYFIV